MAGSDGGGRQRHWLATPWARGCQRHRPGLVPLAAEIGAVGRRWRRCGARVVVHVGCLRGGVAARLQRIYMGCCGLGAWGWIVSWSPPSVRSDGLQCGTRPLCVRTGYGVAPRCVRPGGVGVPASGRADGLRSFSTVTQGADIHNHLVDFADLVKWRAHGAFRLTRRRSVLQNRPFDASSGRVFGSTAALLGAGCFLAPASSKMRVVRCASSRITRRTPRHFQR